MDAVNLADVNSAHTAHAGAHEQAIERAAKLLKPKLRAVPIERATLCNEEKVNQWIMRQRAALLDALKDGPVLIQ